MHVLYIRFTKPASEGRTLLGKKYRENKKDWNNNFAGRIAKDFDQMLMFEQPEHSLLCFVVG